MAEIQLRNVSFNYSAPMREPLTRLYEIKRERIEEDLPAETSKGVMALDNVNLTIPNGQTFAIVGPSGCGKSTLLRVVSGIETNYAGDVLYDGQNVRDMASGERYIGMVFQNYALYPNFNNEGNLSFFFKTHKISDEETRKRIEYTSELMGIGFNDLLPRKPGTLSGGEKQRVAIARAIVRAPRLFLFNEPLSNRERNFPSRLPRKSNPCCINSKSQACMSPPTKGKAVGTCQTKSSPMARGTFSKQKGTLSGNWRENPPQPRFGARVPWGLHPT